LNYLLDTCILIDYLRGEPSVYDLFVNDEKVKLSMSTVTMMELITYNTSDFKFIPEIQLYPLIPVS
jgi:predicted nucleic acid-binding protein